MESSQLWSQKRLRTVANIILSVEEWRPKPHGYIPRDGNLQLDVTLFADDLTLLASTEDDLQRSSYNFHILSSKYNMGISVQKLKVVVFRGKESVPSEICLSNKKIERITLAISNHSKERYLHKNQHQCRNTPEYACISP
jgi:hypothetical protein